MKQYFKSLVIFFLYITLLGATGSSFGAAEKNQRTTDPTHSTAPLFNQLGNFHHPVTTRSSLAQRYFDQGLILFYGFDSGESIRSFRAATEQDPHCAMCWWGLALALGSKNNMPMNGHERQEAEAATKKAQQFVDPKNLSEQAYISALSQRYSLLASEQKLSSDVFTLGASLATHQETQAYAEAMRQVVQKFPQDSDAKDLYAFALFDVNKWHFYTRDGKPLPNTLEIIKILQSVLDKDPHNVAANHFYIHVIEQSPHPELALPSANFLRDAVPGAEHLVHMSSHIDMLTGRYHDATIANQSAIAALKQSQTECRAQGFQPEINYLYLHNLDFLQYAAMMEGRRALSLKTARELVRQTQSDWLKKDSYLQLFLPTPYFVEARFGQWREILEEPKPSAEFQYAVGMWHYARGIADIHLNKLNRAEKELAQLSMILRQGSAEKNMGQFGADLLSIANEVFAAALADKKDQNALMLSHWRKAVQLQDNLGYTEPPAWYFPVREFLGDALLKTGHAAEAEIAFRQDLKQYPNNGWALSGLERSLRVQGKIKEANQTEQAFKKAWVFSDVSLPVSN